MFKRAFHDVILVALSAGIAVVVTIRVQNEAALEAEHIPIEQREVKAGNPIVDERPRPSKPYQPSPEYAAAYASGEMQTVSEFHVQMKNTADFLRSFDAKIDEWVVRYKARDENFAKTLDDIREVSGQHHAVVMGRIRDMERRLEQLESRQPSAAH